jgi:hypothetical protein
MEELRRHPTCSALFCDILDLIKNGLLQIHQEDRESVHQTVHTFDLLYSRCLNDQPYCTVATKELFLPLPRDVRGHLSRKSLDVQARGQRPALGLAHRSLQPVPRQTIQHPLQPTTGTQQSLPAAAQRDGPGQNGEATQRRGMRRLWSHSSCLLRRLATAVFGPSKRSPHSN